MSTDGKMTLNERYKHLGLMRKRYRALGRAERQALLDEMEAITGMHRKTLIRLMNLRHALNPYDRAALRERSAQINHRKERTAQ